MIRTHIDEQYEYFLAFFKDKPVRIMRDRKTDEIYFDLSSVATCLGYTSVEDMMSRDETLDALNEHIQETGQSPFRQLDGQ